MRELISMINCVRRSTFQYKNIQYYKQENIIIRARKYNYFISKEKIPNEALTKFQPEFKVGPARATASLKF